MKIKDVFSKVDKSVSNEDWTDINEVANEVGVTDSYYFKEQNRLKCFFVTRWHCTDQSVGMRAYFLDDEPVALTVQNGRKQDEYFNWVSQEAYEKVKNFIRSLVDEEDEVVTIINLEDDTIDDFYKIEYHEELYPFHMENVFYKGIPVKIVERPKGQGYDEQQRYLPKVVKIEFADKTTQWLMIEELDFPLITN